MKGSFILFNKKFIRQFPSLTLFSRSPCGLCDKAKESILRASKSVPSFHYTEIDIVKQENQEWFDSYAYDVPVIHFQQTETSPLRKIMHHISEKDVIELINKKDDDDNS
ncbi:hypothetical protein V1511DRAFT_369972 [Dipodascopsis uninucleata]